MRNWINHYPEYMKWDAEIESKPVHTLLDETARNYPNNTAFNFLGKKWTWKELDDLSMHMAKGLQRMGAGKGVKIGLFLPNCPYFLIAYNAISRTGATIVNFNPLYSERELNHQIEDSHTDIMVTLDLKMLHDKMLKMLSGTRLNQLIICPFDEILPFPKNILFKLLKGKELAKIPNDDRHVSFEQITNNNGELDEVEIDSDNDVALLQYTGGTTGVPKGAMLTHKNIYANAVQASMAMPNANAGSEKMLAVIPFFHVFSMTAALNLGIKFAAEIIATPRFELDQTIKIIDKEKPTMFPAVPAIYTAINNFKDITKYDLKSLRVCVSGGAPLPVEVKKEFEEKTGCSLVEGYGLTETSPVLCVNPVMGDNRAGSIGQPLPQTDIDLRDPETGKSVKQGERGELCAKGPQVMKGYWNNKQATEETFYEDGYLRTGDVATMDEEGYFYIVDRIKDMIITNGYNVYPRNVEEAIYMHPSVEECIVAGIPDNRRGEAVKAWIKLKEGRDVSESDLRSFLEDKISPMEIPKHIEFREKSLPKTMIGKLSRKDILAEENQ